jgi:hypothetical protein
VESRWIGADDILQNTRADSAEENSLILPHVWLRILSPAMVGRLGLPSNRLGLAPGTGPDRQDVDVFYSRVEEAAQRQRIARAHNIISQNASAGQILGAVIAHEIGHVLLDLASHSRTGIMRGDWELADLYDIATERLSFTSHQAEVIRAELVRRAGQDHVPIGAEADSPAPAPVKAGGVLQPAKER